jgi:hypothetical protein
VADIGIAGVYEHTRQFRKSSVTRNSPPAYAAVMSKQNANLRRRERQLEALARGEGNIRERLLEMRGDLDLIAHDRAASAEDFPAAVDRAEPLWVKIVLASGPIGAITHQVPPFSLVIMGMILGKGSGIRTSRSRNLT